MKNLQIQAGVVETIILFIKTTTKARIASYRLLKHKQTMERLLRLLHLSSHTEMLTNLIVCYSNKAFIS